MKKFAPTVVAGVIVLSACTQPPASNSTANAPYPTANVGVTITNTTNPFFKSAYDAYKAEGVANPSLTVMVEDSNNDQALQYKQYDEMIAKGAKALVINLADVKEGEAVIKKYCEQVALVFFNRSPDEKALANCKNAYFVDGDAVQGGILQGLKVLELWKQNPTWDKNGDGKIQFGMLEGLQGHAGAMARTKWAIGTMENYPSLGLPVQEVFHNYANFNADKTKEVVTEWLASPDFANLEVILANNDTMAIAAAETLKASGYKLPIFGIDATTQGLDAVKAGDITATVLNDAVAQAKTSLRLAANLASGAEPLSGIEYKMEYKTIKVPYQEVQ